MNTHVSALKKQLKTKMVKKKDDADATKQEMDFAIEKSFDEIKGVKDKLTRLANTFDKELIERDKSLKKYQEGLWTDIEQMLQQI